MPPAPLGWYWNQDYSFPNGLGLSLAILNLFLLSWNKTRFHQVVVKSALYQMNKKKGIKLCEKYENIGILVLLQNKTVLKFPKPAI